MEPLKILVTGEHDDLETRAPRSLEGRPLKWTQVPVLRFERLPIEAELLDKLAREPMGWIIFTSPRAVRFWSEVLMESGVDFPLETQVACIGEATAEAASADGFTPDFYPTEPGTEKFLEEFEHLLSNNTDKPTIFIPAAEGGRPALRDRLRELGCDVTSVALYRTLPCEELPEGVSIDEVAKADLVLFTSPSSVDAFLRHYVMPSAEKIAAIGRFTAQSLVGHGVKEPKLLPEGDFGRIGELL